MKTRPRHLKRQLKRQVSFLLLAFGLLGACERTAIQTSGNFSLSGSARSQSQPLSPLRALPVAPVRYTVKVPPVGQIQVLPAKQPRHSDLKLSLSYPQAGGAEKDFQIKAFGCDEVAFARISATGPYLATPIEATGADPVHHMIAANNCQISATLANVPYGNQLVQISLYDAQRRLLTGSVLKSPLRLESANQIVELSYRQLAAGQLFESLLTGNLQEEFLAAQLDLAALQSYMDSLLGLSGTFPNYAFVHHPSLLNHLRLKSDLLPVDGDFNRLSAPATYRHTPGSLRLNLNGYLINQDVTVSLDDALSPNAVVSANGLVTLNNVPPGQWWLRLTGPGYLPTRVQALVVNAGQQTEQGTATIYPPQPVLTSLSPTSGGRNQSITLTGSQFNPTLANNQVHFGSTAATVTAGSPTSLTVTVPTSLASGNYPVSVTIGAASPATGPIFGVVGPQINSLSASSGFVGDSITLTGENFSAVMAQNAVLAGSLSAPLTAATATTLTVTVPDGPAGQADLQVTTNGLISNTLSFARRPRLTSLVTAETVAGKAVLVRGMTLTLNGTGFDPVATNNQVRFTLTNNAVVTATPTTASGNQLSLLLPTGLDIAGDVQVEVRTHSQSSNALTALISSINLIFNGGFQ